MPKLRRLFLSSLLGLALLAPVAEAQIGAAGALLAAREAGRTNDFVGALVYLERLNALNPDDLPTLEALVLNALSMGDTAAASRHAEALLSRDPTNPAAALVAMVRAFDEGDSDRVLAIAQSGVDLHPLIASLSQAWAHLEAGSMSDAAVAFDQVSTIAGMEAFAQYCRALALAMVGDAEGALALIEAPEPGVSEALNRRGFMAYALLLGQVERFDDALALIDQVFAGSADPTLEILREAFGARRALPLDVIDTPAKGMAEVLAVMASALQSAENLHEALLYAQAAVWLNPALSDAQLMVARLFEDLGQPEAAAAAYAAIPEGDAFSMAARMGQSQLLHDAGRDDEAIALLQSLATTYPRSFAVYSVLGDALRRSDQFAQADAAYSQALGILADDGRPAEWQTLFARAIARARMDDWPAAEADFRAVLAIEPDQPQVLNYLGYSLVERREKLDEALEMIERAVAGEPTSGYILDSLAWALFQMGRYGEALPHMERSVEMMPTDAILNDHLGDVYWAVGRQREARFQWRRALSFAPADDLDEDRIRRKLEVGLDAVLQENGEPALTPAR